MTKLIKVADADNNMRLDIVAARNVPEYSRTQLKKWILEGRVLVNNELYSPKDFVYAGDQIELQPHDEEKVSWEPEDIDFEVCHDEKDFLVVNKPHGLVMHPGSGCHSGTLANGLLARYPKLINLPRSGIVHRLDKDTSGVLIVAKTESFRNFFIKQMQERRVTKKYIAISVGETIGSFEVNEPIGRDQKNRTKMSIRHDGKESISFIRLIENFNGYCLLDVSIETGRTHQIRVHLANKKLPIIGDKTYNSAGNIAKETSQELTESIRSFPRQALHSCNLSFKDISSDNIISFESDLPNDIKTLINTIKKHI